MAFLIIILLVSFGVLYKMGHIGGQEQSLSEVAQDATEVAEVAEVAAEGSSLASDVATVAIVAGVSAFVIPLVFVFLFFLAIVLFSSK